MHSSVFARVVPLSTNDVEAEADVYAATRACGAGVGPASPALLGSAGVHSAPRFVIGRPRGDVPDTDTHRARRMLAGMSPSERPHLTHYVADGGRP